MIAAATLSSRYIADRFLPDKAIDLVDEAASRLAMERESVPAEIDQIQRRLRQLELAQRQLNEESDETTAESLEDVEEEIQRLQKELGGYASNGKQKSSVFRVYSRFEKILNRQMRSSRS